MKCPNCDGQLFLYKETAMVYKVPINKRFKISMLSYLTTRREYGTAINHLLCDECESKFDYSFRKGKIVIEGASRF